MTDKHKPPDHIEALHIFASIVETQMAAMVEHLKALELPNAFDEEHLRQLVAVHQEILDLAPLFREQLARAERQPHSGDLAKAQVNNLKQQLVVHRRMCEQILDQSRALLSQMKGMSKEQRIFAHWLDLTITASAMPHDIHLTRLTMEGEPSVSFTHDGLGLLGHIFFKSSSDGGIDIQVAVADYNVPPALVKQRWLLFSPLAHRFLACFKAQGKGK